jgi:ferredoxin
MYAHASEGCLHVRPVLNLKLEKDVKAMRAIAEETFEMVREYKGSHSGEHGDGLVRSEFHETMFGSRIVADFREVKARFDPDNLLNPGKIVDPPKMDDRSLFRLSAGLSHRRAEDRARLVRLSRRRRRLSGRGRDVQQQRRLPEARGRRDVPVLSRDPQREGRHTGPRQHAAAAISGQLGPDALASDEMMDTLKLCVSCKACRHECPDGVDMAKMKIEVLAAPRGETWPFAARPAGRLSAALCGTRVPLRPARQLAQQQSLAARAVREVCRHQCEASLTRLPPRRVQGPTPRSSVPWMAMRSCCSPIPSTAPMSVRISTPPCVFWLKADIACMFQDLSTVPVRCVAGGHFLSAGLVEQARSELGPSGHDLRAIRRRAACQSSGWSRVAC